MSIPVEKRVAICLWHLATGEVLRSLGWRFDVAKSTSCEIINDVCQAIVKILLPKFITWPTGNALRAVVDGFASEWNFPQCAGAIDGTHIPITALPDNPAYYYNRKRFYYSIVLQAVDYLKENENSINFDGNVSRFVLFLKSKITRFQTRMLLVLGLRMYTLNGREKYMMLEY